MTRLLERAPDGMTVGAAVNVVGLVGLVAASITSRLMRELLEHVPHVRRVACCCAAAYASMAVVAMLRAPWPVFAVPFLFLGAALPWMHPPGRPSGVAGGDRGGSGVSRAWALMERVVAPDIDDPSRTFMVRWRIVQTPLFGVYLHRLNGPDQRPAPHDHPWPFLSVVLRGGYTEELGHTTHRSGTVTTSRRHGRVVESLTRTWRAPSIHRMRADDPHTITELHRSPTWTFVFAGPRAPEPSWGYWDNNGWTAWYDHEQTARFEEAQGVRRAWMALVASDWRVRAARILRRIALGVLLVAVPGLVYALSQRAWGLAALDVGAIALAAGAIRTARRQVSEAQRTPGVVAP